MFLEYVCVGVLKDPMPKVLLEIDLFNLIVNSNDIGP